MQCNEHAPPTPLGACTRKPLGRCAGSRQTVRNVAMTFHRVASLGFAAVLLAWLGCGADGSTPDAASGPLEPFAPPATQPAAPAAPVEQQAQEPGVAAQTQPAATPTSEAGPSSTLPIVPPAAAAGSGNAPASEPTPAEPMGNGTMMTPPAANTDPAQLPPLRVWIAGDSTVANGQTPCPRGWGGVIGQRLDARATITNSAVGGRSVHTWLYNVGQEIDPATGECTLARDASGAPTLQARWQAMLDGMQPGDVLFIQFGINDGDPSCDRHVGLDAFETAYGMLADAAKARGAQPIFLTPVSMIRCNGNTAVGSRGEFVTRTLDAGRRFDVPVIDLHALSVARYNELDFCPLPGGVDVSATTTGPVGDFFCDDHTHFSGTGAVEIAGLVAQALRDQALPLAAYLK
jgi:lysophospholipase L1-like esterase